MPVELNNDNFDWAGGIPDSATLGSSIFYIRMPGARADGEPGPNRAVPVAVVKWRTEPVEFGPGGYGCAVCEISEHKFHSQGPTLILAERWIKSSYASIHERDRDKFAQGQLQGLIAGAALCGAEVISNSCQILRGKPYTPAA